MHLALAGQLYQALGADIALAEILLAAVALADADALPGIGQDAFGPRPGLFLGGPQDRPQRQAEADVILPPVTGRGLAHLGNALAHLLQWLPPHHVHIGVFRRDLHRRVRSAGEVHRQLAHRLDQGQVVFHPVMLAVVVERCGLRPGVA
ncbi:hypothetical protein D3C76_1438470 [compost metagenome]